MKTFAMLQRYAQLNRIVSLVEFLFVKSHPESELSARLLQRHPGFARSLHSQSRGFMSCSKLHVKQLSQTNLAKQVTYGNKKL